MRAVFLTCILGIISVGVCAAAPAPSASTHTEAASHGTHGPRLASGRE
jgi:hypothetical protein